MWRALRRRPIRASFTLQGAVPIAETADAAASTNADSKQERSSKKGGQSLRYAAFGDL